MGGVIKEFLTLKISQDPVHCDSKVQTDTCIVKTSTLERDDRDQLARSRSEEKLITFKESVRFARHCDSLPTAHSSYSYASGYVEAEDLPRQVTEESPRLQKRLIICCDGTWNNGLNSDPDQVTNVLKLARCIFPEDRRTFPPVPQLVYYQAGIGTTEISALNLAQGATGTGISSKIREAYGFIAQNYIPGDEVFLFGFSRGAFTARTIASLIADIGILTNAGMEDFYQVLAAYQVRGEKTSKSREAENFLNDYRRGGQKRVREMPKGTLKCVGVWDTVGALGIPRFFGGSFNLLGFRDTKLSHHIMYAFHAMAIHETRKDFMPTKWQRHKSSPLEEGDEQVIKQVWFSGSHSDVGGGNKSHDLSDISLIWMVANLIEYKLLSIDEEYLLTLLHPTSDWGEKQPTDPRTGVMILSSASVRAVPTEWDPNTCETIHASVRHQRDLTEELVKIFESKEGNQLVDVLLPFENKIRKRWQSFISREKSRVLG